MTEYLDLSALMPIADSLTFSQEPILQPTSEPFSNIAETSPATSYEGGTNAHPPVWRPTEPQFTKAIAQYYGVSRKSVQQWFQKVRDACPWFDEGELRLPDERYTPLCVELMGDYRTSGLIARTWGETIAQRFADRVEAWKSAQSEATIHPEVLPQEEQPSSATHNGDRPGNGKLLSYQRSSALDSLLNSRPQIAEAALPDENPLVLAIRQKVSALSSNTASVRQQLEQVRQMAADTHEAIQTLEDLEVVERAQAKADRHYWLEKQAYTRRLEELGVEDVLGKSQSGNAQPQSA